MFITKPIKNFKLADNKVYINESVIEYEDISDENREILESLISKGAYGSALLTLNMFYNVKSINESDYTQGDYEKYLEECNSLMEECVSETEAHNFRPLINLNGLEIMESADHIARGKGNKLLVEDFRLNEEMSPWMKFQNQAEQMFENAKSEMEPDMFSDFCNAVGTMAKDYEFGYNEEDDLNEECEGTQCSDIAEKKDQEVGSLQKPKRSKKLVSEMFSIHKNHGFKGFRLNEYGIYTRGNYVLVNESGSIKAVNKKLVEADIDLLYKTLHLDQDLEKAMIEGASKVLYIDEDEVKDYCSIEFEEDEDSNYVRVYFLAEVDYMDGTKIVYEYLDGVITKYDKDAYFEAETTGRWVALVRKECLN